MGEIRLIALDRIRDNPFQARRDYRDIADLARKISDMKHALPESRGLIHAPTARLIDHDLATSPDAFASVALGSEWHVELAEGHRRLRAFFMLRDGAPDLAIPADPDYAVMPVSLVELEDEAMDDIAWDENTARKDLSPVEEARSLQCSMDAFHLTQNELANRRRLGRSTVANKLRLLALPDDLLQAIHDGRLTERHGMSYLPLMDIPAADMELVQKNLMTYINFMLGSYWPPHPDTLRKRLLMVGDLTADQVRAIVDRLKARIEEQRRSKWDHKPYGSGEQVATETISATSASEATQAAVREAAPVPRPMPTPSKPAPVLTPLPAESQEIPIATMPVQLADVGLSVRIKRDPDGKPLTFTLSIGSDDRFPEFYRGAYDDLPETVERSCRECFQPGGQTLVSGEQVLMEIGAGS